MATAIFVKTHLVDSTDATKSQAVVTVEGQEVIVAFWHSLIEQWGKDGVKQFVCAEALKDTGNLTDAHELLKADAKGKITLDTDGKVTSDTRSWQKKWMDENPIVPVPSEPEVDPLA